MKFPNRLLLAVLIPLMLLGCIIPGLRSTPAPGTHQVENFRFIRAGMGYAEIAARVGPGKDIGSGLHIFAYDLADGRQVLLGFADLNEIIYGIIFDPAANTSIPLFE
jgi:hypothetical protein